MPALTAGASLVEDAAAVLERKEAVEVSPQKLKHHPGDTYWTQVVCAH